MGEIRDAGRGDCRKIGCGQLCRRWVFNQLFPNRLGAVMECRWISLLFFVGQQVWGFFVFREELPRVAAVSWRSALT